MARDAKAPEGEREREYLYALCATCRLKVNIYAFSCPRCKNRVNFNAHKGEWTNEGVYGSADPDDKIYGTLLCSTERCMVCAEALRGNPCRYAYCFGTGRGRCALCERFEAARCACCRERQKENAALAAEWAIQNDPAWGNPER
jgi:hypothetical protein